MTRFTSLAVAPNPSGNLSDGTRSAHHDRIGALGDEITNQLFLAGLDLCSALSLATDESVRVRLEHAVAEIDDAIKDLRHLMVAALGQQADPGISGS